MMLKVFVEMLMNVMIATCLILLKILQLTKTLDDIHKIAQVLLFLL